MPKYSLMAHQVAGVKFLHDMDGIGALLWEPGVGKTGATLSWVDEMADKYGEMRVLVVAPLTAADTWVLQPHLFMDSPVKARMLQGATKKILVDLTAAGSWTAVPDAKIMINHKGTSAKQVSGNRVTIMSISAGAVSSWCQDRSKLVQMLRAVRKFAPHLIVMDESHIIKSANANISKAMYNFGQLAPHRIILTGTVNPHSYLDVYGQWRFMAPWTFSDSHGEPFTKSPLTMTRAQKMSVKPWPIGRFTKHYTTPGGYKGKGIGSWQNLPELKNRIAERSMVVLKKDALDLPPVTDVDVHVTLTPREHAVYREMQIELAALMDSGELVEAPNALSKMMKLRQIAAGFVKDTETGEIHVIGNSLQKAMREIATTQLAAEQRIVMFAYFQRECAALAADLRKSEPGTVVEVITGSTKGDERLAIRQRFGDLTDHPERIILVAQVRTMSISVNELVTAQHAIYGSPSERREDKVQSRGRLDRQGQKGAAVTFWNCFVPGTVGEIMLKNHANRGELEQALFDHIRQARPVAARKSA